MLSMRYGSLFMALSGDMSARTILRDVTGTSTGIRTSGVTSLAYRFTLTAAWPLSTSAVSDSMEICHRLSVSSPSWSSCTSVPTTTATFSTMILPSLRARVLPAAWKDIRNILQQCIRLPRWPSRSHELSLRTASSFRKQRCMRQCRRLTSLTA